jgi:hypothetical protein
MNWIKVTSTITFTYLVPRDAYPNMTDDEIFKYEESLDLGTKLSLIEDAESVDVQTSVVIQ